MAARDRRARAKPLHISYEAFRTAADEAACCGGTAGEGPTTLAVLIARGMTSTQPAAMLEAVLGGQEGSPVHGVWHHALVGEILLVCLRNAGYPIGGELIDEVVDRGRQIPGGACGFLGSCGALVSAASAYAVLLGSTPVATGPWEQVLAFSQHLLARLTGIGGSRCCKKSSYVALELAQQEFAKVGFALPREQFTGRCPFFRDNETCDGAECPFFPQPASMPDRPAEDALGVRHGTGGDP